MSEENLSAVVPQKESKQDKEARRQRWEWVEHSVWTDRMLRTLERGIEGGRIKRKGKAKGGRGSVAARRHRATSIPRRPDLQNHDPALDLVAYPSVQGGIPVAPVLAKNVDKK